MNFKQGGENFGPQFEISEVDFELTFCSCHTYNVISTTELPIFIQNDYDVLNIIFS